MTDDQELLHRRLLRRDQQALDILMDRYLDSVHRLAQLIIGHAGRSEDVEEAASEAFARAWERIDSFDPARTSLRSWLLLMAKYAALDRRRQILRQQYLPEGPARVVPIDTVREPEGRDSPEEEALRREQEHLLRQALDRLPDQEQSLLIRRYFLEEPIMELARDLGLSRAAIDNRLWRARQALKAAITQLTGGNRIDGPAV